MLRLRLLRPPLRLAAELPLDERLLLLLLRLRALELREEPDEDELLLLLDESLLLLLEELELELEREDRDLERAGEWDRRLLRDRLSRDEGGEADGILLIPSPPSKITTEQVQQQPLVGQKPNQTVLVGWASLPKLGGLLALVCAARYFPDRVMCPKY